MADKVPTLQVKVVGDPGDTGIVEGTSLNPASIEESAFGQMCEAMRKAFTNYEPWKSRRIENFGQEYMNLHFNKKAETPFENFPTFMDLGNAIVEIGAKSKISAEFHVRDISGAQIICNVIACNENGYLVASVRRLIPLSVTGLSFRDRNAVPGQQSVVQPQAPKKIVLAL